MNRDLKLRRYRGKNEYSYSFGGFPTIELLKNRPESVVKILIHSDMDSPQQIEIITNLCYKNNIPIEYNDKDINRIKDKGNIYIIGVFIKYQSNLSPNNHILLDNPSDMGNVGTIIRTALGFDIRDIGIIRPGVDFFNPRVVRASMGAIFSVNIKYYDNFKEYERDFPSHKYYPFILEAENELSKAEHSKDSKYTLIFGNEATGLGEEYINYGKPLYIKHSENIDSLNLSLAVGIALYHFSI